RADLLAPDLPAIADLLETTTLQRQADHDALVASITSNVVGLALGLFAGPLGLHTATLPVYLTGLATMATSWLRLRGGDRPESALAYLTDPRPERWGRRSETEALRAFGTGVDGLSSADAAARKVPQGGNTDREELLLALRNQVR